ncbi:MAG: ATP synthase F1 subunit delta [Solirubrobacteraceae bacterium MAG38_C4-C5]|nr:ATP synthase F1 subunit delta [Candidatus Siliceabacter maunaloa]
MEEIAEVYARSLFEVASGQEKLEEVRDQIGQFADALDGERELAIFFFSPYFSSQEKKDGLRRAVEGADEIVANFLELLIDKHRMPAIFAVRRHLEVMWERENKVLPVQITSATQLDEETVKRIGDRIGQETGQRVELTAQVEPAILGGIVLRVGNQILDASIRARLDRLRRQVARGAA